MVTVPLDVLNLLLAAVLPIATALVTSRFANSTVKTCVLALLTVLSTSLQQVFTDNGDLVWRSFVMTTALQFLMSVGFHLGLLKPTGITGASGVVATTVPAGIGGDSRDASLDN
jgi:predicted ABC-type exoprotein transport system permease subunit